MATLVIMMHVLCGVVVSLIVLTSCQDLLDERDELTKAWIVTLWILGWPWKLYKAFHDGVMIYDVQ